MSTARRRTRLLPLLCIVPGCSADHAETVDGGSFEVESITPAAAAADVELDAVIEIEFTLEPTADLELGLTTREGDPVAHVTQIDGTTVTVTPTDPLWIASDYELAIPASARSLSGVTLGEPFTSGFATRDGAWAAVQIHAEAGSPSFAPDAFALGSGASPNLGVAPDGTVLAAWENGRAVDDQIYRPGAGWAPAAGRVDAGGDPTLVQVAVGGKNSAVMAYTRYFIGYDIDARTYTSAGGWSTPVTVAPSEIGDSRFDQYLGGVAAADTGHALTLHRGDFETGFELWAAVGSGSGWGEPVPIAAMPGSASESTIAPDGRGGFVIVWIQRASNPTAYAVWMTTLSTAGAVGQPVLLEDGPGRVHPLSVAHAGDRVQVAWGRLESGQGLRLVTRAITAAGAGQPHTVTVEGSVVANEWIRVAASPRHTLLVWSEFGGVFASLERDGRWGATTTLAEIPGDPLAEVGMPSLALDGRGNATVVWTHQPSEGRWQTMVARSRGGSFAPATVLDGGTASTYVWSAGVDPAGRVTAMWTQSELDGYSVWAGRLE